ARRRARGPDRYHRRDGVVVPRAARPAQQGVYPRAPRDVSRPCAGRGRRGRRADAPARRRAVRQHRDRARGDEGQADRDGHRALSHRRAGLASLTRPPGPRTYGHPKEDCMLRRLLAAVLTALATPALAATWTIDPVHTSVAFSIRHLMVSNVRGQFRKVSGTVTGDESAPTQAVIQATIDTASVDTGEPKRDDHLRSPDFFDA